MVGVSQFKAWFLDLRGISPLTTSPAFLLCGPSHQQPPYHPPPCIQGQFYPAAWARCRASCPECNTACDNLWPALLPALGGKRQGLGNASFPRLHCHTADKLWGQLSPAQGDSPALGHQCVVPVRCRASLPSVATNERRGQLFRVSQPLRGGASSA